jgi:hypothetical protein
VNEVAVTFVFTSSPLSGEIDADTLPDVIWLRFNPTMPEAGILYSPDPSPVNEPV